MNYKTATAAACSAFFLAACGNSDMNASSTGSADKHALRTKHAAGESATVSFAASASNYTIAKSGTGYIVTEKATGNTGNYVEGQRLQFTDITVALDLAGNPGMVYRLYQAAFDRTPDLPGLGWQITAMDKGVAFLTISQNFIDSAEFKSLYGENLSDGAFVTQLYKNVLHRDPEQAGYDHWVGILGNKTLSRAEVLYYFSESDENQKQVNPNIQNGVSYLLPGTVTTTTSSSTSTASTSTTTSSGASTSSSTTTSTTAGASTSTTSTTTTTTAAAATVPGAPTIGTGTAGNSSASIAFTVPTSNGGSTITGYTVTCTSNSGTVTASGSGSPVLVTGLTNSIAYSCSVKATNAVGSSAASGSVSVTPTSTTAGIYCPYSASVANSALNLTSTVSITCTSTQRLLTGNGVPDHTTGTFPNSNNPNSIKAVSVNNSFTLTPTVVSSNGTAIAHKIGFANNSVAFDPATAESYQNKGVWKIEAIQSYMNLGLDSSNAHVQPDGTYHYHGMPEGYMSRLGKGSAMTLVGFALDGFPIYARYGYSTATNAGSAIKVITPSYRVKSTPDSGRPSTSTVPMGTFTQDYEYVAGLGDLDECNGRFGVTPEFPGGIYHYYVTDAYPYIQRCAKGNVPTGPSPSPKRK